MMKNLFFLNKKSFLKWNLSKNYKVGDNKMVIYLEMKFKTPLNKQQSRRRFQKVCIFCWIKQ